MDDSLKPVQSLIQAHAKANSENLTSSPDKKAPISGFYFFHTNLPMTTKRMGLLLGAQ